MLLATARELHTMNAAQNASWNASSAATTSTTIRQGDTTIGRYAMIGCGQQKQDTDKPVSAEDLYTSPYFSCKQRYAETVSRIGDDAPDGTPGYTILIRGPA